MRKLRLIKQRERKSKEKGCFLSGCRDPDLWQTVFHISFSLFYGPLTVFKVNVLVRVLQGTELIGCVYMESEIPFKELTLKITEASTALDMRLERQGRADVAIPVQRSSANKIFSHLGKIYLFFYPGLQLIGWNPSTFMGGGHLLYSESIQFKC